MDTEINQTNIIAHIAGLTNNNKKILTNLIKKSKILKNIELIDLDEITDIINNDSNTLKILKGLDKLSNNKNNKVEYKNLEKKLYALWKVKFEYYINKIINESKKKIILIGYISYNKNHRINLNLLIKTKFFVNEDYDSYGKEIIKNNLIKYHNLIIEGLFDLNNLNKLFLIKQRNMIENIYKKINYKFNDFLTIINTIELYLQTNIPAILYYASFNKYDKKIPYLNSEIYAYNKIWLSIANILNSPVKNNENIIIKGIKNNKNYIILTKNQYNILVKSDGFLYEITDTCDFLPFPTKNNLYKFYTSYPIKIHKIIKLDNIINEIKNLNIDIIIK